jgi:hypothetical protein
MENLRILTTSFADIYIFPRPTTFPARFCLNYQTKMGFHLTSGQKGKTGGFLWSGNQWKCANCNHLNFHRWGTLQGRPNPGFEDLSWSAAIWWFIFELNPFKFKLEIRVHKINSIFFGENTSRWLIRLKRIYNFLCSMLVLW